MFLDIVNTIYSYLFKSTTPQLQTDETPTVRTNKKSKQNSLQYRMTKYIKNANDEKCHSYKPHIISLKSQTLLSYINKISSLEEKLKLLKNYNAILIDISKELYNVYDPHMIYCFNNEIHLVFYYNENGDYIYNGDIIKTVSTIVSYTTMLFCKKFIEKGILCSPVFNGIFVEFNKDYETLNYLIWRQYDCKRNNITLLYKCLHNESFDVHNVKIDYMLSQLQDIPLQLIHGNIVKKQIYYTSINITEYYDKIDQSNVSWTIKDEELVTRKDFSIEHIKLDTDFKNNMKKYIKNKLI